jgi:hypothetical protein
MIDKAIASGWKQGSDYFFESTMILLPDEEIYIRHEGRIFVAKVVATTKVRGNVSHQVTRHDWTFEPGETNSYRCEIENDAGTKTNP